MVSQLSSAIAEFGSAAKAKLANIAASGAPEDQLRAPLESLIKDLTELCGRRRDTISAVGETSLAELQTRPDYAVTLGNALVGFIEIKRPGKGADPRQFQDVHDKDQWKKLQSLPNLLYTDGNEFSLWQNGELVGSIVRVIGDIETSGGNLDAPPALLRLFDHFIQWEPIAPRDVKQLAETSARLCRLLREEVTEQLQRQSAALTALAADWRRLLFPEASDAQFADGYSQAVTFGLLIARARDIKLADGIDQAAKQLGQSHSLIGTALRVLTDDAQDQRTLETSLGTLTRVLDVVDWSRISRSDAEAWLYFYEDFLEVYDNELRKQTGSYYTPPEVVETMVRLVDEVLRSEHRFGRREGLASPDVTLCDPAAGTGTFLLGVYRRIAESVAQEEGQGAVPARINAAVERLTAFEMQLGPFAVAQLRIQAELKELIGGEPRISPRMYVTDTLGDPYIEQESLGAIYGPIAESRQAANAIKRTEPITVVMGNPPYKEKAKGRGGWVEREPLASWMPPRSWGVGAHGKHLRNLYVYFWRWASWKVFESQEKQGIVCFITVAGFLNGPGFQKMRDDLRRSADEIWVIDCSPEGHQPEVNTRIFQGVQQPVCIVLVSRSPHTDSDTPAKVRYRVLPTGRREEKFQSLQKIRLRSRGWKTCSSEWRAPFLPQSTGDWAKYPALDDFFNYNGSGVMPGRTWVIAPDVESLRRRWDALVNAPDDKKEALFHPHLRGGQPGDKHIHKEVSKGLPGYEERTMSVAEDAASCIAPIRYAFRSFDRQWIIPDNRLINQPNPELWNVYSKKQIYLTAFTRVSPASGPALTFTCLIPDLHHYKGNYGGRVFPLYCNREASQSNVSPDLLVLLHKRYRRPVNPTDVMAYIAAVAAHPAFTERFQEDLVLPGLRIPLTSSRKLFGKAVALGSKVIWLHTFAERFVDARDGRPARLPRKSAPKIPKAGAISQDPELMPGSIDYDSDRQRLLVGDGYISGVSREVWEYEVSGKQVVRQWFSYRKRDRTRPVMGDRRPPSKLGDIQPGCWLSEYTSELLNVLNVLGQLVALEPEQSELLEEICAGPLISADEFQAVKSSPETSVPRKRGRRKDADGQTFFVL